MHGEEGMLVTLLGVRPRLRPLDPGTGVSVPSPGRFHTAQSLREGARVPSLVGQWLTPVNAGVGQHGLSCDACGCPQSHLPDGICLSLLAIRCLRKASRVTLSGPPCCARSPRPWGSPSCRPKWTVTSTARSRCVSVCKAAPGRGACFIPSGGDCCRTRSHGTPASLVHFCPT